MNCRLHRMALVVVSLCIAGCGNPPPAATVAETTVPPQSSQGPVVTNSLWQTNNPNDPNDATSLEHELLTLKSCHVEGLITATEYGEARDRIIYSELHSQPNLSLDGLHAELTYLAGMKVRATISPDEFERVRRRDFRCYMGNYVADPPASQPASP